MHIPTHASPRRHRSLQLLSSAAAVCLAVACRSEPPAPPPVTISPDTWAVVDGRQIMRADVDTALRRAQGTAPNVSQEELYAARLGVLDDLIVENLLLERARVLKVEVPDSEVDAAFTGAKQNLSEDEFQAELKRRELTAADVREGLRRELLAQKAIEREVGSKVNVTDQEVTDFFNANRAQFNLPEDGYRLAQIVVTPVRDPQPANRVGDDASTPEQAAEKVRVLMQRLKAGIPFAELASDHSEDPQTAPRGGDLGLVPGSALKRLPPQLRDAVLKAAPGAVNVVTVNGIHTIVLMMGREPAGQRDLSTPGVRDNITTSLRGRREQLLRAAYLTALRTDANVINYLARRLVESSGKLPEAKPPASDTK
jgi:peptidyl-prolyl cis-trans isomerase SurA